MNLNDGFYALRVPHQSRPTLTWFRDVSEFKIAYELGWQEYASKDALIADAGWQGDEIPEEVRALPHDVPIYEWSFGWQPSRYEVGAMTDDVIEMMVREAAGHDMHASRILGEDDLASFRYSGHQEAAVNALIRRAIEEAS